MSGERRAELTGVDKAVSETLDEVNVRMHGIFSGGSSHREFLDWLAERDYVVVPASVEALKLVAQARADELAAVSRDLGLYDHTDGQEPA